MLRHVMMSIWTSVLAVAFAHQVGVLVGSRFAAHKYKARVLRTVILDGRSSSGVGKSKRRSSWQAAPMRGRLGKAMKA